MKRKTPPHPIQEALLAYKEEHRYEYHHITEKLREHGCSITDQYLRLIARGHKLPGPNVVRALSAITRLPQREFRTK